MVRAPDDLQVVVEESDSAEAEHREHGDPDVRVLQVRPEQRRDQRRRENQQAAHRRRAGLGAMGLRTFLADDLSDLEVAQLPDHPGAEQQADGERRQARGSGSERVVRRHVQDAQVGNVSEPRQEVVQHQANPAASASTTTLGPNAA